MSSASLARESGAGALMRGIVRSVSLTSMGSAGTAASSRTIQPDESEITRSDRLPLDTVFSSPFVMSMTSATDLLVFSANGSVPGAIETLSFVAELEDHGAADAPRPESGGSASPKRAHAEDNKEDAKWVHLVPTPASLPRLAFVTWPDGRVAEVELSKDLNDLTDENEQAGQLRLALALVPVEDTERTLVLRRLLAAEARALDWHDGAIKHLEAVINIAVKSDLDLVAQKDLVVEAVELRGPSESSWRDDASSASLWADFLYQLRRRIMRPGPGDTAVLETLCAVDVNASRIKALLSVPHAITFEDGKSLINSHECSLLDSERIGALVALYQSLEKHDNALSLLEESGNSLDEVSQYLTSCVNPELHQAVYFHHLSWLAAEPERQDKLMRVIVEEIPRAAGSLTVLTETMHTLVKGAPNLIPTYVEHVVTAANLNALPTNDFDGSVAHEAIPGRAASFVQYADVLAKALLGAMIQAQRLEKWEVIAQIRPIFRSQVLNRSKAEYDIDAMLSALRACPGLDLHEELAFLHGQQGQHSLAAAELAAEKSISSSEAKKRLRGNVPAGMYHEALESLAAAYLSMADRADGRSAAAEIVATEHGHLDAARVLRDASKAAGKLKLCDAREFAVAACGTGTARLRMADMLQAVRKSEARRLKEELLVRRRQHVVVSRDRVCSKCGRPIGDSVIAAYPNGDVSHLMCHLSASESAGRNSAA
jgi:hypothetical protein